MVVSLNGLGVLGPPSQYVLNVVPRVKFLLVIIFICGILRAVSTALKDQPALEGVMDLSSCLFGYFLFRNVSLIGQCACGFMSMCFLNAIYDTIFSLIWFSQVGTAAFRTSGSIDIRSYNVDLCWRFPVTSITLIILPAAQGYTGYIGYRMFKSMQSDPIDAFSGMDGSGMGMAQVRMLDHGDDLEGGRDLASADHQARRGFVPFSGPGRRL